MSNQNTSDLIEAYLKKILEESNKIESVGRKWLIYLIAFLHKLTM